MLKRFLNYLMKNYEDSDFLLQQKARVLMVIMVSVSFVLIMYGIYFFVRWQNDPGVIIPFMGTFVLSFTALFLLRRGHFTFFAQFLLIVNLIAMWAVNFFESGPLMQRTDSIVLVVAALTMTPLIFLRKGRGIIIYYAVNLAVFILFSFYIQFAFNLEDHVIREYMIDNTLAFIFSGIFCYSIFVIYKRSLDRAEKSEEEIQAQYEELAATSEELEAMNDELIRTHNDLLVSNQRINEERDRLAITLRSIGDGVITVNSHGAIETMNKAAEEILCIRSVNGRGRHINDIFRIISTRAEEVVDTPIDRVLADGRQVEMEGDVMLVCCDGSRKLISSIASPLFDSVNNITGAVIAFRDITERKRMEEEMFKASKIESLGIFAGGIAHDFNNLLTAILGSVSIVRIDMDDKDRNREFLMDAERACLRAKDLTQQLLTFSKGGAPIKTMASLNNIIIDTTTFVLSGSSVQCNYNIEDNLWNAEVDRGQISQVIHNLVLNARQAMSSGGIITVSAGNVVLENDSQIPLPAGRYIRISVKDFGHGISPDVLTRIFEPFYTTKMEGNGLGLAVSASIIKNHNGYITAESIHGEGSDFIFYLPASMEDIEEQKETLSDRSFEGIRVLLMDDDEIVLRVAENMLQRLGCTVVTTRDGAEAIDLYMKGSQSDSPFHIVIMDLTVPGAMGGKDAMMQLKRFDPLVRAVVSSGYANDPVMARYGEYGFIGYIVKPYKIEELGKVILKALT